MTDTGVNRFPAQLFEESLDSRHLQVIACLALSLLFTSSSEQSKPRKDRARRMKGNPTIRQLINAAYRLWAEDGKIRIGRDAGAIRLPSNPDGAWVSAWVFVRDEDAQQLGDP